MRGASWPTFIFLNWSPLKQSNINDVHEYRLKQAISATMRSSQWRHLVYSERKGPSQGNKVLAGHPHARTVSYNPRLGLNHHVTGRIKAKLGPSQAKHHGSGPESLHLRCICRCSCRCYYRNFCGPFHVENLFQISVGFLIG